MVSRPVTRPERRRRTAPTPSRSPAPSRSSSKLSIGAHSGHVAPSRRARERLLAGTMERGVGNLSLRGLAAPLGTSHRMLIYHFGSCEGLRYIEALAPGDESAVAVSSAHATASR